MAEHENNFAMVGFFILSPFPFRPTPPLLSFVLANGAIAPSTSRAASSVCEFRQQPSFEI
jgi:hypothetical protein